MSTAVKQASALFAVGRLICLTLHPVFLSEPAEVGRVRSGNVRQHGSPLRSCSCWVVGTGVIAIARIGGSAALKVQQGRERIASIRNLEKIAAALNAYAADHGAYPVPAIEGRSGKPLLSWRVMILPYLGEQALYDQFNFNRGWDDEGNQNLTYQMPVVYRHPNSQGWSFDTVYHLVTGNERCIPIRAPWDRSK